MDIGGHEAPGKSSHTILRAAVVLLVVYLVAEATHRLYVYHRLKSSYKEYVFWTTDTPLYDFDPQIGYRYHAGAQVHMKMYDARNHLILSSHFLVNNHGHLSPNPDSFEKPASQFRIVTLGDSFTACPVSDVSWPTALEEMLNKDTALKKRLTCNEFKVINLGQDGTGFIQFAKVDAIEGQRYAPDLVIVSFITDDITRRFVYRGPVEMQSEGTPFVTTVTCPSLPATLQNPDCASARQIVVDPQVVAEAGRITRLKRSIYDTLLRSLPWFSPYPGLFVRAVGAKFGMRPKIEFKWNETNPRYEPAEAIQVGLEALRDIRSRHQKILIVYHPTQQELLSKEVPELGKEFLEQSKEFQIVQMAQFLPAPSGAEEIKKWYNPGDGHPSAYGAQVYAQAVCLRVKEYLGGQEGRAGGAHGSRNGSHIESSSP